MIQELLGDTGNYLQETFESMTLRYSGFGKELYTKLKESSPIVFSKLIFYKRVDCQCEDSYAIYLDNEKSFAIQLDPLCKVIVLWNNKIHVEFGIWSSNLYAETFDFIKLKLLTE